MFDESKINSSLSDRELWNTLSWSGKTSWGKYYGTYFTNEKLRYEVVKS